MIAAVLGLGKTLKQYKPGEFDFTVGVNDIFRYHETDYVVCIDHRHRFKDERKQILDSTNCSKFYSHCDDWIHVPNFHKVRLVRGSNLDDSKNRYDCSNNSTHVAAVVAYKMGAREIVVYGADFYGDHKFFKNDGAAKMAVSGFSRLRKEMNKRGVGLYVGHAYSKLSKVLPVWKR